jgi:hypothetical protein
MFWKLVWLWQTHIRKMCGGNVKIWCFNLTKKDNWQYSGPLIFIVKRFFKSAMDKETRDMEQYTRML